MVQFKKKMLKLAYIKCVVVLRMYNEKTNQILVKIFFKTHLLLSYLYLSFSYTDSF